MKKVHRAPEVIEIHKFCPPSQIRAFFIFLLPRPTDLKYRGLQRGLDSNPTATTRHLWVIIWWRTVSFSTLSLRTYISFIFHLKALTFFFHYKRRSQSPTATISLPTFNSSRQLSTGMYLLMITKWPRRGYSAFWSSGSTAVVASASASRCLRYRFDVFASHHQWGCDLLIFHNCRSVDIRGG